MTYETIVGLEVHAQLLTRSKAFCSCPTTFGLAPNSTTCPVCLGMPGALPVVNKRLVEFIVRMGLATGCTIRTRSTFARKNYFYPDLPKGYQISQFNDPICHGGAIEIELGDDVKKIGITRIHMEEDAGKSIHDLDADTLVDLNRSGVPLIEIVSEPDMRSAAEAVAYLKELRKIVMTLGICDGSMEEGSLRCDVNVSVRPVGQKEFNPRVEIKNLNSFKSVEGAIEYEVKRQTELYESESADEVRATLGNATARYDVNTGEVKTSRAKEAAHDYRYFPEPDLVPVEVSDAWIDEIRTDVTELPLRRKRRFISEFGLPAYDASILTEERATAEYFETACTALKQRKNENYKLVSNWVMTEILRVLTAEKIPIDEIKVTPARLAELVDLIASDTISGKIAKDVFPEMLASGASAAAIVESKGLVQNSDAGFIEQTIDGILAANAGEVEKYRAGKTNLFGFFVGQTLKATQGKANPKMVNEILRKKLDGK